MAIDMQLKPALFYRKCSVELENGVKYWKDYGINPFFLEKKEVSDVPLRVYGGINCIESL
jgi:hypothetical protein